jgi:hypothetical protein
MSRFGRKFKKVFNKEKKPEIMRYVQSIPLIFSFSDYMKAEIAKKKEKMEKVIET